MPVEIELKLSIAPRDVAALRRHPLLQSVKPVRRKLYGIYFDTPGFDLFKRRSAFRLRREGYHWVQTVKLDRASVGGLSMRPEYEVQVTGNQPDFEVLPPEARAALGADIEADLVPRFVTDFQRTTWHLEPPEGCVEVALDVGHVRAGERDLPVAEVELELKSGDDALLFAVAQRLLDAAPLLPEFRSKALRGYELAGVWQMRPAKAGPVEVDRSLTAAEAWRRTLLSGLDQLGANLPGLLADDDPEYVHQARVAVRRLRTMLGLGRALGLAQADWVDDLRWFMTELSPARDWDVFVDETLAGVRSGLPDPERLDGLLARAEQARRAARLRARAAVADRRLGRLLLGMGASLLRPREAGPGLPGWARQTLDKRLHRFNKAAANFDALDASGRHQVRIAAKRLRYAGEAFSVLFGKRASGYLGRLARMQDALGIANDQAVAQALLGELNRDGRLAYEVGLAEGFLAGHAGGHLETLAGQVGRLAEIKPFWR